VMKFGRPLGGRGAAYMDRAGGVVNSLESF
jgi:hypothetical protein